MRARHASKAYGDGVQAISVVRACKRGMRGGQGSKARQRGMQTKHAVQGNIRGVRARMERHGGFPGPDTDGGLLDVVRYRAVRHVGELRVETR